jgi:hypothetical protein
MINPLKQTDNLKRHGQHVRAREGNLMFWSSQSYDLLHECVHAED